MTRQEHVLGACHFVLVVCETIAAGLTISMAVCRIATHHPNRICKFFLSTIFLHRRGSSSS